MKGEMYMKNQVDLRKEHEAVRNNVAFYDFTHELLEVTGKDAARFLDLKMKNSGYQLYL